MKGAKTTASWEGGSVPCQDTCNLGYTKGQNLQGCWINSSLFYFWKLQCTPETHQKVLFQHSFLAFCPTYANSNATLQWFCLVPAATGSQKLHCYAAISRDVPEGRFTLAWWHVPASSLVTCPTQSYLSLPTHAHNILTSLPFQESGPNICKPKWTLSLRRGNIIVVADSCPQQVRLRSMYNEKDKTGTNQNSELALYLGGHVAVNSPY